MGEGGDPSTALGMTGEISPCAALSRDDNKGCRDDKGGEGA